MNKNTNTIDDVLLIPVLQTGDSLYHYTSAEGLKGICDGQFWITESHFLNDYTEFNVATDVFFEMLDNHISNTQCLKRLREEIYNNLKPQQSIGISGEGSVCSGDYVISFCLDRDSALMWSEFSDFSGYCIEFDYQKLLESFTNQNIILHGNVIYDHNEQLSLAEKSFAKMFFEDDTSFGFIKSWNDINELEDSNFDYFVTNLSVLIEAYNIFFKNSCFQGECEYRFVFFCMHDGGKYTQKEPVKQFFRVKNEVLIPFIKQNLKSLASLKSVLVGPKNNSDLAIKGVECLLRSKRLFAKVEKSQIPLRY